MSNVVVYPSSEAIIYGAIDNVYSSIRRANIDDRIAKLGDSEWGDLMMEAVVRELREPFSGLGAILTILRRAA